MATTCRRLENRTAIVTGGSYGIGKAISIRLAEEGANVFIADRKVEAGEATAASIRQSGRKATFVGCDVSRSEDVKALIATTVESAGGIDVLVNNAGIPGVLVPATELNEDDWEAVISVNLGGVFRCAKYALPYLIKSGHGSMINFSSSFGMIGSHNSPAYGASKGGVIALSRQLAVDFGPHGVRVNALSPGFVDNDMDQRRTRMTPEAAAANLAARVATAGIQPLGRQADPAEIASAVAFLASDDASFVTGAVIPVDGGCTSFFNFGAR